jgi:hypothetical protein
METLQIIWSFTSLFSLFAVPQLLGVLIYFRLRRFGRGFAHVAGVLLTTTSFICLSYLFFLYLPAKAHPDERCGLPLMAAMFTMMGGTAITVIMSVVSQAILNRRKPTVLAADRQTRF